MDAKGHHIRIMYQDAYQLCDRPERVPLLDSLDGESGCLWDEDAAGHRMPGGEFDPRGLQFSGTSQSRVMRGAINRVARYLR
jgi:hypothetical protein